MEVTQLSKEKIDIKQARKTLFNLVSPERNFFYIALIYGLTISLLTLAVPIAVQTLINTVINIASIRAIITLATLLFITLFISGAISALRTRVMELFERRIYARLTAELSLKTMLAQYKFFEGGRNTNVVQHYFDIMILQKNIPALLIDGFALVLQMTVGFTLVSFYHPTLFLFNVILIGAIYLIWRIWGKGAIQSAIKLSYAKYHTAKWLSDLSSANHFFKSSQHIDYAGEKTESLISTYVEKHKAHFSYTFAQTIMFLLMYAVASSLLLGLGGWLVIKGELSIGQLVAAELILFAIFFGLSQFTNYLRLYYELYGAADKVGKALAIPQEKLPEGKQAISNNDQLEANNLVLTHGNESCTLNFKITSGHKVFVLVEDSWIQHQLVHLLRHHSSVEHGALLLGGQDLEDYDVYELRQAVTSIDRSLIVECTIKEYLRMDAPDATITQMKVALARVKLDTRIENLTHNLDTCLSSLGTPLLPFEFLLLKLAAAFLSKPQLIILNQHIDNIPAQLHQHLLHEISKEDCTVLYFTHHPQANMFDKKLVLSRTPNNSAAQGE